jgi:ornithine carbamoyltransferase
MISPGDKGIRSHVGEENAAGPQQLCGLTLARHDQGTDVKDYLEVLDLTRDDLNRLLDLAVEAREMPHLRDGLLADEIVFCYFSTPSTRARISFAAAITHLGGEAEFVGPAELQLDGAETIEDTAMVVSRYASAAVIGTFEHSQVTRFASAATIPVINALTDMHHPCQALADMLTVRDHLGSLQGRRVAYLGDGNNVAHSLIQAAALAGLHLVVGTPAELAPDMRVVNRARAVARRTGATIDLGHDPAEAVKDADVVYTDVWPIGDPPEPQERRMALLAPFRVDEAMMDLASPNAIFMHCLPAHRGDEVVDAVLDGRQSVVGDQAENRLHTEQALLVALLTEGLTGRARKDTGS